MSRTLKGLIAATLLASVSAASALAHPGHGPHDLAGGLEHPFTGLDHMLAMTAVGLWAAVRGGRALWAWPAAFLTAMLVGYAIGRSGVSMPLAEPAILASIMGLGAMIAANAQVPTALGAALIAAFGLAHGYAHGAEAPAGASLGFPLGFALSTATLHLIGLAAGLALVKGRRHALIRILGAGVALGGAALALGT